MVDVGAVILTTVDVVVTLVTLLGGEVTKEVVDVGVVLLVEEDVVDMNPVVVGVVTLDEVLVNEVVMGWVVLEEFVRGVGVVVLVVVLVFGGGVLVLLVGVGVGALQPVNGNPVALVQTSFRLGVLTHKGVQVAIGVGSSNIDKLR